MGNLLTKARNKNLPSVDDLIKWYLSDLEEYYPESSKHMKDYKSDLAKHGSEATAQLTLEIIRYCANKTQNDSLKEMITPRYIGAAAATFIRNKNAKAIYDLVFVLQDLKETNAKFADINIDYKKYSQAIAESGNLEYNRLWIESFDEYAANYNALMNSNDAESAWFLANFLKLSKEDFEHCEKVVLNAKNADISCRFTDIEGSNITKHRKVVIDSKNAMVNSFFLVEKNCSTRQVAQHKAAMYTSNDEDKLKAIVLAISAKPSLFSENEINDIIKTIVKNRKPKLAKMMLICDGLTSNQQSRLQKVILNSKDKNAVHLLTNVRFSKETRELAKEREKELQL